MSKDRYVLGIDPGETIGLFSFNISLGIPQTLPGLKTYMRQVRHGKPLWEALRAIQTPPDLVICERFRVLGDPKIFFGKEVLTEQAVGTIKAYAWDVGAELIIQDPEVMKQGYTWGKFPRQSDHSKSHKYDAGAHVYYYLVTNRLYTPPRPIIK